jgi:hypothetical protein
MRFCFVSTSRGSRFMTELLASLAAAVEATGHSAELVLDEFPSPEEDRVYVVVPHEFDAWAGKSGIPDAAQRARTIALCTENLGTLWFEETYRLVAGFGAAVSINRSSAAELRRRRICCEHLQLGYFAGWDRWHRDVGAERPIDVLYLGAADQRRDALLAGIGASLWTRECHFLVPPLEPRTTPRPDFLEEGQKYDRLSQSKVLLNLHRTTSAACEWMRFLEAICNGCVVVSEPSLDAAPLVAGQHFVEASAESMANAIEALLDDPERLRALRVGAYDFVREQLPIAPAGERLVELASELPREPPGRAPWPPPPAPPPPAPPPPVAAAVDPRARRKVVSGPGDRAEATDSPEPRTAGARWRAVMRQLTARRGRGGEALVETPAYASATPHVSVLCFIPSGRERESVELFERVAASTYDGLEMLIADECPADGGRAATGFVRGHRELAALLLPAPSAGLAGARNLLARRARGEHLLVLPPAGGVFPATVERLARALEADVDVLFSYSMVAVLDGQAAVELRGSLPWEPQRLLRENWIDTPALIRRQQLLELGGWATDPALRGLEDFELWCRCAQAGRRAAHVPQVLAWHPRSDNSQPRDVGSLAPTASALLRERCPTLFAAAPAS